MRRLYFHELTRDGRIREALRVAGPIAKGSPHAERRRIVRTYSRIRWALGRREADEAASEAICAVRERADIARQLSECLGRAPCRHEVREVYEARARSLRENNRLGTGVAS